MFICLNIYVNESHLSNILPTNVNPWSMVSLTLCSPFPHLQLLQTFLQKCSWKPGQLSPHLVHSAPAPSSWARRGPVLTLRRCSKSNRAGLGWRNPWSAMLTTCHTTINNYHLRLAIIYRLSFIQNCLEI